MIKQDSSHGSKENGPINEYDLQRLLTYVRTQAEIARQKGTMRAIVNELILELLCHAGLRPKEMCDLNVRDISTSHNRPVILVRSKDEHRCREVSIPKETDAIVRRFVSVFRTNSKPNAPLLLSERGNRFSYVSIYSKIRRVGELVDLPNLNPNRLRRTYMARLFSRKQDLRLVQQQAGHAHLKTTALYVESAKVYCEACNGQVMSNHAEIIDSGQLLCLDCLKEFRA